MNLTVIIIVIISFLLILSLTQYCYNTEKFETNEVELVISRYNEDLEWLKNEPYNKYEVIVYNKGQNDDFYKAPNIKKIIKLDNVGREGHTYLHHIIHNYEDLANLTIFLPGSLQLSHKMEYASSIFEKIPDSSKSILNCIDNNPVYSTEKDFKIDHYLGLDEKNKQLMKDGGIQPSNHRPFGNWFVHHFGDEAKDTVKCNTKFGVLSVSKEDVQKNTVEHYRKFFDELNSPNPEAGHYIERSWAAIFGVN